MLSSVFAFFSLARPSTVQVVPRESVRSILTLGKRTTFGGWAKVRLGFCRTIRLLCFGDFHIPWPKSNIPMISGENREPSHNSIERTRRSRRIVCSPLSCQQSWDKVRRLLSLLAFAENKRFHSTEPWAQSRKSSKGSIPNRLWKRLAAWCGTCNQQPATPCKNSRFGLIRPELLNTNLLYIRWLHSQGNVQKKYVREGVTITNTEIVPKVSTYWYCWLEEGIGGEVSTESTWKFGQVDTYTKTWKVQIQIPR